MQNKPQKAMPCGMSQRIHESIRKSHKTTQLKNISMERPKMYGLQSSLSKTNPSGSRDSGFDRHQET